MGILDFLTAGSPAAAPTPAPAVSPTPNYNDFYQRLIAAATANGRAHPTSLFNWLSGRGTDADVAAAQAGAPGAYQQLQQGQTATQSGQLGNAQNFATNSAMTGVDIDPNNPMASLPGLTAAYRGVFNPGGAPGAPGDQLAQQRAYLLRSMQLSQMRGDNAGAAEYFKAASQGLPANTTVLRNGQAVDGSSGAPLSGGVGAVLAGQAKPKAEMEAGLTRGTAAYQAGLDRGTHAANADVDASHELVNGIDPKTGQPVTRTRADILTHGGYIKDNPYFESQQAELKDLRGKSESADQGLNLGSQIVNAANGVTTGKGANLAQDIRKLALTAGQLTGTKVSDEVLNDTSQFEQLKFASQQLVAVASHDLSPRVAMNIYNQIAAVKPGDQTSIKGLRDIIINQLVPVFQRNKALFGATTDYYKKNPITNDAASKVPDSLPLASFGVRDIQHAKPGDYFIDPITQNLRQRPK